MPPTAECCIASRQVIRHDVPTMAGSPDDLPPRKVRLTTVLLVIVGLLLSLWILGLKVWHGSNSPFNTLVGKAAFIGLFVIVPIYVHARVSRLVGWLLMAGSVALWVSAAGTQILIQLVSALAGVAP